MTSISAKSARMYVKFGTVPRNSEDGVKLISECSANHQNYLSYQEKFVENFIWPHQLNINESEGVFEFGSRYSDDGQQYRQVSGLFFNQQLIKGVILTRWVQFAEKKNSKEDKVPKVNNWCRLSGFFDQSETLIDGEIVCSNPTLVKRVKLIHV